MSNNGGRSMLLTSAVIVATIRIWMQVRGKATTPFQEWITGYGALFFVLGLLSEVSASAAGSLSLVVVAADFLQNGVSLTDDISSLITGGEKNGTVLVSQPFETTAPKPLPANSAKAGTLGVPTA